MSTDNFLPDEATFAALGNLPDDEPVIMLNLLEFPGDGGAMYAKYGPYVLPQLQKRGAPDPLQRRRPRRRSQGRDTGTGSPSSYYPSRAAFLDMMADPDYQAGLKYRTAGLTRTVLYAFTQGRRPAAPPLDLVPTSGGDEIFVLNLLRFKPDGGREEYQKYGRVVGPMIRERGGNPALILNAQLPLVSEETWEDLYLVRYPSLDALRGMVATEDLAESQRGPAARPRPDLGVPYPLAPLNDGPGLRGPDVFHERLRFSDDQLPVNLADHLPRAAESLRHHDVVAGIRFAHGPCPRSVRMSLPASTWTYSS